MKMKKLIALFICLVTCCLFLASCEEIIGDYLDEYDYVPDPVYNVMYDFYIICEDGTDEMAKSTVNEKINQVIFVSATPGDYESELVDNKFVEQIIRQMACEHFRKNTEKYFYLKFFYCYILTLPNFIKN